MLNSTNYLHLFFCHRENAFENGQAFFPLYVHINKAAYGNDIKYCGIVHHLLYSNDSWQLKWLGADCPDFFIRRSNLSTYWRIVTQSILLTQIRSRQFAFMAYVSNNNCTIPTDNIVYSIAHFLSSSTANQICGRFCNALFKFWSGSAVHEGADIWYVFVNHITLTQ